MPIGKLFAFRRVSFADCARDAAEQIHPDDPAKAGALAREVSSNAHLQRMQTEFDQMERHAASRLRGEPWPYTTGFPQAMKQSGDHVENLARVLRCTADAADRMLGSMSEQLNGLEDHMSQNNPDEGPQLTPSGEPHPLEEGGYDSNADEARPASESDVAALKAGHATPAMAEALAASDTANPDESPSTSPPPSAPPTPTPTDAAPGANLSQTPPTPPRSADAAPTPPDDKGKAKSRK
jgi:hypothetical protein